MFFSPPSTILLSMRVDPQQQQILETATKIIVAQIPPADGIYLFGSFGTDYERKDSDIDLAVLGNQMPDSVGMWNLAQEIAREVHRDVDLINLAQASTVFRYQIITEGTRILTLNELACDQFELQALSRYYHFNEARQGILEDYKSQGETS